MTVHLSKIVPLKANGKMQGTLARPICPWQPFLSSKYFRMNY